MGLFNKNLKIGEGQKYDVTQVTTNEVLRDEAVKKNNKLIKVFNYFNFEGGDSLSSLELARAMDYIEKLDDGDGKLSKKELEQGAKKLNEELGLQGKGALKANDLKDFVKNIINTTKKHEKTDVGSLLEKYEKQQAQLKHQAFLAELDKSAAALGCEPTETEGVYFNKENKIYIKYNAEKNEFHPAKWVDETQSYEYMTQEEYDAATKPTEEPPKQEEKPAELHKYTVQPNETLTQVIKKSLAAQGITNPTPEQISEAKEQFKKNNPNAVKTTKDGYEYLMVGAEVNLSGEVKSDMNSKEAIDQWSKDHPDLVWKPTPPPPPVDPVDPVDPPEAGKTPEERAKQIEDDAKSIAPDLTPKHTIDETLQNKAKEAQEAIDGAPKVKAAIDEALKHDWLGASAVEKTLKGNVNSKNVAYIVDGNIAERIDDVLGLDKKDVVNYIIKPLMQRCDELGLKPTYPEDLNGLSLDEMQVLINGLSESIKVFDKSAIIMAGKNVKDVNDEKAAIDKLKQNKALFDKSVQSLARAVDTAENDSANAEITYYDNNKEQCKLPDGTQIFITRDKDGNIIKVSVLNPNGPDEDTDVSFWKGKVYFDEDGKANGSGKYAESISTGAYDFDKIKALAERIFGIESRRPQED